MLRLKIRFWALWLAAAISSARGEEMRGLWVDAFGPGFLNKAEVKQLVDDCRRYNFNAVFVQMRKRGDAFYFPKPPNEDPRTEDIAQDFDALQTLVDECHNSKPRIQVHCWVVGYFIWAWNKPPAQPEHVFNKHPELLTKTHHGETVIGKGYFLDPGNPAVNTLILNTAKDIVSRYDVDGLHWDYLRYPEPDSGYNEVAIRRYQQEFGVLGKPKPDDPQFCEWRRRQVTDFMRWSSAELLSIKPSLIISTAVFANYQDSYNIRFQDWVAWNREGLIDAVVPMDFSGDNKFIFEPRADFASTNQWSRTIWLGVGGYKSNVTNLLRQLNYARAKRFEGTVIYDYRHFTEIVDRADTSSEALSTTNAVILDNRQAEVHGEWQTNGYGKPYGEDYYFKTKGTGLGYLAFRPQLPSLGLYDVYEWHVAGKNRSKDTPYEVICHDRTNTIVVDQQANGARWNKIGRFSFAPNTRAEVRITDNISDENQVVIADAIKFVSVNTIRDGAIDQVSPKRRELEKALTELRTKYQRTWTDVPKLSWKTDKAAIEGQVTDKSGQPIYNAIVEIIGTTLKQQTEPHGAFAFFNLAPGNYTARVTASDYGVSEQPIQCGKGQIVGISVKLRRKM